MESEARALLAKIDDVTNPIMHMGAFKAGSYAGREIEAFRSALARGAGAKSAEDVREFVFGPLLASQQHDGVYAGHFKGDAACDAVAKWLASPAAPAPKLEPSSGSTLNEGAPKACPSARRDDDGSSPIRHEPGVKSAMTGCAGRPSGPAISIAAAPATPSARFAVGQRVVIRAGHRCEGRHGKIGMLNADRCDALVLVDGGHSEWVGLAEITPAGDEGQTMADDPAHEWHGPPPAAKPAGGPS